MTLITEILDGGHEYLTPEGFIALEVDIIHREMLAERYKSSEWSTHYLPPTFLDDMYERPRFAVFYKRPIGHFQQ